MKKIVFLVSIILIWFCSTYALADSDLELNCTSAILMDAGSQEILYEMQSQEKCYPASVTKIMTLVLILEAIEGEIISLDDKVIVSEEAASMGGAQVYLYAGEERTVEEMIIAISVGSGNDAAYAMAEYIGGTLKDFVKLMNERAAELGMQNTNFINPHGLHDENHYTSAFDMGLLAFHALSLPNFLDYTSIYEYEFRPDPKPLTLWNTNRLLKWYEGTDGMKTGYTEEAGRNLVTTVERDGMRLISIILGATERQGHFNESMKLLNFGFSQYEYVLIHQAGEIICQAPVSKGASDTIDLSVKKDIGYSSQKGIKSEITESMEISSNLQAPLLAGQTGGKLIIYRDDKELISTELIIANDLAKGNFFNTWRKLIRSI